MINPKEENSVNQQRNEIDQPPQKRQGQRIEEWVRGAAGWAQQEGDEGAPSDLLALKGVL